MEEQRIKVINQLRIMQRKLDNCDYDYFVVDRRNRPFNEIYLLSLEETVNKYDYLIDRNSIVEQCKLNRNSNLDAIGVLVVYKDSVELLANTTDYLKNVVLENVIQGKDNYWD